LSPIVEDNNVAGLQVQPDKTLALIGRDIVLTGGILNVPGGHIELGSVDRGLVTIESNSLGLDLDYSNISNFQNIQMSHRALVTTSGIENGPIEIQTGHLKLSDGSLIWLQNQNSQANGSLNIKASNSVEIIGSAPGEKGPSGIISEAIGNKNGSDIKISTGNLLVQGLFAIINVTYGSASSGDLYIDATNLIEITGFSPTSLEGFSSVGTSTFSSGAGGKLILSTENLIVQNGASVGTITQSSGSGGDIVLSAENLTVKSRGNLGSQAIGSGSGGNTTLTASHLTIQSGGLVGTSTRGSGKGGDASINISETLKVTGVTPGIFSPSVLNAATFGSGNAGNLVINTANLIVEEGGRVDTSTLSSGKAGNLFINASDYIQVSGGIPGFNKSKPN
jgi:large exoprotein involved in heme utilization and adhesion